MLFAHEAARKAKEVIEQHKTDELKKIEDGINREINLGRFVYNYSGYISTEARKELERCGYIVETGSQYNECYVVIKWSARKL